MEGTCITKHRTKKPEDAQEWSWEERLFHGCNIFPGVLHQGNQGFCTFCSTTSAGQMELNAAVAKETGQRCLIRLDWSSLVTRFLELNGLKPEDSDLERKKLEEELFEGDGPIYDTTEGAVWCFKHMGINAVYYKDGESLPGIKLNLSINDYKRFANMDEKDVREYIEAGRAIKTRMLVGFEFHFLEKDEIYAWWPEFDEDNKLVEEPGSHVLVGNGDAGPSLRHEQYHPFLNSYGKGYARDGVGCVFFKGLKGPFYLLEMKANPKLAYGGMSQLPPPPFRTYAPPPPGRPASPPCPAAFTTPPAHGRFPAPPRPGAPSTQNTARYLLPWHSSRGSCSPVPPPPPPHGHFPAPPHPGAFTTLPPHGRFPAP